MRYPDISRYLRIFIEIGIVETPVMRQVGADQHHVACFKMFDTVADELCALTFFKMDQFDFGVIMPAIINIRHKVAPYTKRMLGFFGHF
jgi:hypothetical protein